MLALVVVGTLGALWSGCGMSTSGAEREDGYANVFLSRIEPGGWDLEVAVRAQSGDGSWLNRGAQRIGRGDVGGVGLAQRRDGGETLLGYTVDGTLKLYPGKGLTFQDQPVAQLQDVAAGPSIAYVGGDSWLVAYSSADGRKVEVRPFSSLSGRLGRPLDLSGIVEGSGVLGRPAVAYADGQLVLAWGRSAVKKAIRYLVAKYDSGANSTEVIDQGEVPKPPVDFSDYVAEPESSPALTEDGAGTFYLGAVYRGVPGRPFNTIRIYSSQNGSKWRTMNLPFPGGNKVHTGQTHIGLAARATGVDKANHADLLLAIVSGSLGERTLQFSAADGFWTNLERAAFVESHPVYDVEGIAAISFSSSPTE